MTTFDRFDERLADALHDLAAPQHPDYFDDVLDRAMRRSQRPAWTFPERWLPVSTDTARRAVFAPMIPWRQVSLLLVILALLIVAVAVAVVGSRQEVSPAPPYGPAENGLVAVARDGNIFSRDMDAGSEQQLISGPEHDVFPFFSRDGTQLAFVRVTDAPHTEALFVANADGGDPRQLISADTLFASSWSPDGTQLAVITGERLQDSTITIVGTDGSSPRTLNLPVNPLDALQWRPPDGRELIFRAERGDVVALFGVRQDGTGFRQISADGTSDDFWVPALSPDGSTLAYTSGGDRLQAHMIDLETGEDKLWGASLPHFTVQTASPEHWGHAVFSPDGTRIAFGRYWNESTGTINHQVFVATVASDGADAVALGDQHRSQAGRSPFEYDFSPDGTKVIIWFNDVQEVWLADPVEGEAEQLSWGNLNDPPNWQRRGQ